MKQKYDHIISLGKFCGVAMDLERKGLRTASYPFDWVISESLKSVLFLIKNNFMNFLSYENLVQEKNPSYYWNSQTDIHFFHDFNSTASLSNQISSVQIKYQRRIDRFYKDIKEPTLFVRYCNDELEEDYIRTHGLDILQLLRSYNSRNQILYIMGGECKFEVKDYGLVAYVKHPDGDIERNWINAVPNLKRMLYSSTTLSSWRILRNLYIHYRSRIKKRFFNKNVGLSASIYRHEKQLS